MATILFSTRNGGAGDDVLGAGINYVADIDTYFVDKVVNGLGGNDSLQSVGLPVSVDGKILSFASTLNGGDGDDFLSGNDITDVLNGGSGDDYISGGRGKDRMDGGAGRDTVQLDTFDTAARLRITYAAQAAAIDKLGNGSSITGFEAFYVNAGAANDFLDLSGDGFAKGTQFIGGGGNDELKVDSLTKGGIIFAGGEGNDRLSADLSALWRSVNLVSVAGTSGGLVVGTLEVSFTDINGIDIYTGAGNDTLTGSDFADLLDSGGGNDSLDGGLGRDVMRGGDGKDDYVVSQATDAVIELPDQGVDSVVSAVSISALADNVENLTLNGGAAVNGGGNALDNVLTGNENNNKLSGFDGDDVIEGQAGNDKLTGGLGRDIMTGGGSDDRFVFQSIAESAAGSDRDRIADFRFLFDLDVIQVSAIDAAASIDGDQDFVFIAGSAFTAEGQIRAFQSGANTRVQFNTGGGAEPDMEITLLNFTAETLAADHFML